jgi:endonuclease/exonuclease/phosphatase family metal-dependent hydrolase
MADQPVTLRVLTFNVLSVDHADGKRRHQAARSALRALQPDVVALQETVPGDGRDQALDLLGSAYHVVEHPARSTDSVGAVVASRWPFGTVTEVDVSVPPRVPSAVGLAVEIELPAPFGPSLFLHHAAAFQFGFARERELQALASARFAETWIAGRGGHVVLLGDFNDTPDSSSVRFLTGRQSLHDLSVAYQDAWTAQHPAEAGHTFSPTNPLVVAGEMPLERGRRIDYIMVRSGSHGPTLDVAGCRLVLDEPIGGVWASDHFGVLAELRLPDHPPGAWS